MIIKNKIMKFSDLGNDPVLAIEKHIPEMIRKHKKDVSIENGKLFDFEVGVIGMYAVIQHVKKMGYLSLFDFVDQTCKNDEEIREVWNGTPYRMGYMELISFYKLKDPFFNVA